MKHYRILEKKITNDITNGVGKKEYTIQYLKKLFFGLYYWKKVSKTIYYKYEEAFNEVKQLIVQSDYDNLEFGYHYIDAYKIFKTPTKTVSIPPFSAPTVIHTTILQPKTIPEPRTNRSKAVFVPKTEERKTNKSVFIPKNK